LGIYDNSNVTVNKSIFKNNKADGWIAFYAENSPLKIENSLFINNFPDILDTIHNGTSADLVKQPLHQYELYVR